ncbi:MAG: ABC transporter ATP-binding protein [Candidatus Saccharimonadales bacterium]
MREDDIAIKVENVSKNFKLPHEKVTSIKSAAINFYKRKRSYETQQALQNISFNVKKGEFFGIVGRNGSGKSTMLKILAGIYSTTAGTVQVNGTLTPFIELGVGFNPELTGRENVFLNGALLGFNRKQVSAMYKDIVAFAELERFMDQKLKNYSSGMQVRLAFSIAIRADSDILLIDEVLAVGDQSFQDKCFRYFDEIKKSKKTVVFISHDGGAIEKFCDRAAIIDRSEMVDIGNPRDMVYKYGAIVAGEEYAQQSGAKDKQSHKGTGIVKIKKVELIGKDKKPTHVIAFNEPFAVKASFSISKKPDERAVIGVDIIDEKGVSILSPNTKESLAQAVKLHKSGSFEASFKSNPLAPGKYSVTVGIFNERQTFAYELMENALQFKIIGDARNGKIYIEPEWAIVENTK